MLLGRIGDRRTAQNRVGSYPPGGDMQEMGSAKGFGVKISVHCVYLRIERYSTGFTDKQWCVSGL